MEGHFGFGVSCWRATRSCAGARERERESRRKNTPTPHHWRLLNGSWRLLKILVLFDSFLGC
eukprot:9479954-Pyramimonas_sp.AAC.1